MRRAVVLVLLALAVAFGGIYVWGAVSSEDAPINATVTGFEPGVSVSAVDYENATGDGVAECISAGPPPGNYGVTGAVDVGRPAGSGGGNTVQFRVAVAVADDPPVVVENVTLEAGDAERVDLFAVRENDGTARANETVPVRVRVAHGGDPLANATRSVTVRSVDDLECEDGG